MPISTQSAPEGLRPYLNLGVDLQWREGDKEAKGECPFCGGEEKFSVDIEKGVYRCFVCAEGSKNGGGNARIFIRRYHSLCFDQTSDYRELSNSRKIKDTTLIRWGVCRGLDGQWLVPAYGAKGEINTLYRYTIKSGNYGGKLMATAELGAGYFRPDSIPLNYASKIYITEGPWDGMALWEILDSDSDSIVIAVPGANTFTESWAGLDMFQDKDVILLYDNDHPILKNGKRFLGAGFTGMKRASGLLTEAGVEPERISFLSWGESGYDPTLPSGFDLRDSLLGLRDGEIPENSRFKASSTSLERFGELGRRITLIPREWVRTKENGSNKSGKSGDKSGNYGELPPLECTEWEVLQSAWKEAMEWTDGLDCALSVMLASVLTTQLIGEQLWIKIISPPGSGKTTLLEGLSVAKKYLFSKDTIRGFYTGFGTSADDDNSIAALANGKTLAIKDGDTLLKSPNLPQILSEGRGLYDGAGRTHYRNSISRDYEGHRMTWLLCGTSALREIDDSELGSRFLDCVIMEGIDEEFERSVGLRAGEQELKNLLMQSNGVAEERHNPDQTRAMQLTGGYVEYLRENDVDIMSSVSADSSLVAYCNSLASFVSRMRARPSRLQEEESTREFSARLVKQLVRLSVALAAVMGKSSVDSEVKARVNKVARDTSRGITLEIAGLLFERGNEGYIPKSLGILTDNDSGKMLKLLRFLKRIGVVINFKRKGSETIKWRLTNTMRELYVEVMDLDNSGEETI